MKILIVSGFLGAGKTTFIQELNRRTPGGVAVLENEYGASGIDGDALAADDEAGRLKIWEMTEGCICCSMKRDFAASVLTIANSVDPDVLVVEPTGVGSLSAVLQNLRQIEYERITLLAPVTIVDGHSFGRYLAEYPELYRDQIRAAHTLLLSKMEQADAASREALCAQLRGINPAAQIVSEHYTRMGPDFWQGLLARRWDGTVETPPETAGPQILPDSYSLRRVSLRAPGQLILLAEGLIRGAYGNIIRAKGVVEAGGVPLRLDVADGRYVIGGAQMAGGQADENADGETDGKANEQADVQTDRQADGKTNGKAGGKMVFIGTNIDRARLDALLCPAKQPGALKLPQRFAAESGAGGAQRDGA